jgi:hypothetical protein
MAVASPVGRGPAGLDGSAGRMAVASPVGRGPAGLDGSAGRMAVASPVGRGPASEHKELKNSKTQRTKELQNTKN